MFQVRIHGRSGQGVVSGAQMLSIAAFQEGRFAQAFPSFGSECADSRVTAYCRIDDKEIRLREPVMKPNALIIHDLTLLHQEDIFDGLNASGYLVINSPRALEKLELPDHAHGLRRDRLFTVPATEIAMKHVGRPVPNVPLLGGLAAVSGCVRLDSVIAAIRAKFAPALAEANVAAAAQAYAALARLREAAHA